MYTVRPRTSAVVNSRRSWNQKVENLEASRELTRRHDSGESSSPEAMTSPKPVFQPVNGRKAPSKAQPEISAMHEELIRYLGDSWNKVSEDLQASKAEGGSANRPKIVVWESTPEANNALKDFVPFDLEGWWGTRLYQNLTQTV